MGLSLDFTGLSTLLLGQAQPAQFQSGSQYSTNLGTTWSWGSKCTAIGTCESSSAKNNNLAQMPRSFNEETLVGHGNYYNWYAATAESGTFALASGNASNSLCPAGWQLPVSSGDKSWENLTSAYELTDDSSASGDSESTKKIRKLPLSVTLSGYYYWTNGGIGDRLREGNFWSSTTATNTGALYLYTRSSGRLVPSNYNDKPNGFSIRCVRQD